MTTALASAAFVPATPLAQRFNATVAAPLPSARVLRRPARPLYPCVPHRRVRTTPSSHQTPPPDSSLPLNDPPSEEPPSLNTPFDLDRDPQTPSSSHHSTDPHPTDLSPRTLLLISIFGLAIFLTHPATASTRATLAALPATVTSSLETLGPLRAGLLLFAVNFSTVLFCFPANMGLMIAAGALLPIVPAFLALYLSKLCAAMSAFALARGAIAAPLRRWFSRRGRLTNAVARTAQQAGWQMVILLRLSPFPGFLLNYLLPLAGVPWRAYLLGTIVGVAPSVLNLVLIGNAARQAGTAVVTTGSAAWLGAAVRIACVAAMLTVMVIGTRTVQKTLEKEETLSAEFTEATMDVENVDVDTDHDENESWSTTGADTHVSALQICKE